MMNRITAVTLLLAVPVAAQQRSAPATEAEKALPLRRVSLYKNGIGFFEHAGTINGAQHVRVDFTTAQLNDVLQTLTAVDLGGGHITGAGYNSTTPLDQQLKNLPITLSENPTASDFYQSIRGAHVEVTGSGAPITGRILNVELRNVTPARENDTSPVAEKHFLTIVSDAGAVRSVELNGNTSVRLLDATLRDGVGRYLQVLNAARSDGLRHLTLTDAGTGARELRVSYISEVPVWKSTYRILFDTKDTATLQGWAVVDNTVGTDWENVQLSLVAGAPQSFIQPISQPYYARRPEIELPKEAQLSPQTHESGEAMDRLAVSAKLMTPPPPVGAGSGMGMGYGSGNGPGSGGNTGGGTYRAGAPMAQISYEDSAAQSVAVHTTTHAFDDFFEYKLSDPITLRRNESALVPILQAKIPADRVTLWSEGQVPLRALWITNTSKMTLDRGSFSIVESGNFGGQGLLDPVHPGEKRLLSYAADQAVKVTNDGEQHTTRRLQQIKIAKGMLTEKTSEIAERTYLVHNAAADTRTVVVEHKRHPGWELDSDPKPEEETAAFYRYRVVTQPNESVRLHVGERHTISVRYALANFNENQLNAMLHVNGDLNPETEKALRERLAPVIAARQKLSEIDAQIAGRNQQVATIGDDQKRLRENLSALKASAEERDLVRRYTGELNQQEDKLTTLHREVESLQAQRVAAQADLDRVVQGLEFEQAL